MIIDLLIERYGGGLLLTADGYDAAILGVDEQSMRIIYSVTKCIAILIEQGMEFEDAQEYFFYNVQGAYVGELTPIWCYDDLV